MFRTVPLSIIRIFSLYTQQWYMLYIQVMLTACSQAFSRPVWHTIAVCTVKNSWWWTEELSETCRVLFQNKFEKLLHLVGFIIRIYHDARSPERRIWTVVHKYTTVWASLLHGNRIILNRQMPYRGDGFTAVNAQGKRWTRPPLFPLLTTSLKMASVGRNM